MLIETALLCLSLNIYFEARSEQIPGQYAVAQVTMNRVKRNDSNVCKEVLKPKQFSWTNVYAWQVAKIVAGVTLSGKLLYDISHGAEFYHTESVNPRWNKSFVKVKQIGKHVFYKRI
jgi:spore germination cell wall hydrolase CwlJ-like protein